VLSSACRMLMFVATGALPDRVVWVIDTGSDAGNVSSKASSSSPRTTCRSCSRRYDSAAGDMLLPVYITDLLLSHRIIAEEGNEFRYLSKKAIGRSNRQRLSFLAHVDPHCAQPARHLWRNNHSATFTFTSVR
jgi:hypothetical protein